MFSTTLSPPHSSSSHLFLSPPRHPPSITFPVLLLRPPFSPASLSLHHRTNHQLFASLLPVAIRFAVVKAKCFTEAAAEDQLSEPKGGGTGGDDDDQLSELEERENRCNGRIVGDSLSSDEDSVISNDNPAVKENSSSATSDLLSLGIPEPVYEVVEVTSDGTISTRNINRRHLLKSSGLRPRDIRSVDPSLWLTNSMPSLLIREHAILLNLGSLRAIVMQERVLIFNYNRRGGKAFIDSLLPRLSAENTNGGVSMPFVLEVVEAALVSRIQRLERRMMELEPRVQSLLEVLPNRLTGGILEQLRTSKQTLVELGSRAGALRQMLLDLLEDTEEICRICIMGRNCTLNRITNSLESSVALEKQIAEEEEEEIEMLLENYLQS